MSVGVATLVLVLGIVAFVHRPGVTFAQPPGSARRACLAWGPG